MPTYLIIEDEPLAARRLMRLIRDIVPDIHLAEPLDTVSGAVAWLQTHTADLLFMDIHLADGACFSIFEQVEVKTPVIFTTAYDQYALRAFKHNSVDYLLKPIEAEELAAALTKYHTLRQAPPQPDLRQLLASLQAPPPPPTYQKRFMVTAGDKIKSVPVEEVAYFYGQQKYVFLITRDNRRHLVDYTLSELETLLHPDDFFRINRQFILGFSSITGMTVWTKNRIKADLSPHPDEEAIVSIEKTRSFKEWLNR
ncbi:MAG: LytTR family DNA-binding domain-containing protein [Bacteroidia bacterium]|nr:LytTR family DNA-binding domain-containing protein [Bacteroidia bacterium]